VPFAGQLAAAQGVPCKYFWQPPSPHIPFVPHVDVDCATHVPEGSGAPVGTSMQSPIVPATAHDRHVPVQAVPQQTPWAQKPETHSPSLEQEAPIAFLPHELWASHVFGATQSPLS
jgi:hypothetical protein